MELALKEKPNTGEMASVAQRFSRQKRSIIHCTSAHDVRGDLNYFKSNRTFFFLWFRRFEIIKKNLLNKFSRKNQSLQIMKSNTFL
jgi:hypothetical protein